MINSDLITYIKTEQAKGTAKEIIQANLVANGWSVEDIAQAEASIKLGVQGETEALADSRVLSRKYRIQSFFLVFFSLVLIGALFIGVFISPNDPASSFWFFFLFAGVGAIASLVMTSNTKLSVNQKNKISDTVFRVVGAIFLTAILLGAVLFAFCLYAFSRF